MTDLDDAAARERWDAWVREACAAVGVDPELVDVTAIHALTRQVAHRYERPMAPVSSYILGLAVASGADPDEAREALEGTLP